MENFYKNDCACRRTRDGPRQEVYDVIDFHTTSPAPARVP